MGIDLDNINQVLLKPEFFAINILEATHELPINDEIILKEIKLYSYWIKSQKTISCYSSLVPENLKNPCKTRTMRTDYSCIKRIFISLIAWMTLCDNRLFKCTVICHLLDTQVSRRPMSLLWLGKMANISFFFFSLLLGWSIGRYHVTVTKSQKVWQQSQNGHSHVTHNGITSHSHSMWQRSQLMSSIETMGVREHSHIVIVYIV